MKYFMGIVLVVGALVVLPLTRGRSLNVEVPQTNDNNDEDVRYGRGDIQGRIIGGKEVIARIPHQVAVEVRTNQVEAETLLCGGSLIAENYVLTGAQCLDKVTHPVHEVRVTAGGIFLNANMTDGEKSAVRNIFIHPQWNNKTLENDIAIIETFPFKNLPGMIDPIRLPSKRQSNWSFWLFTATASGWGKIGTDINNATTVLRSVDSRVLKNFYCKYRYSPEVVRDTNICTSGTSIRGLCRGDEGGPLFIMEKDKRPTLIGIASFKGFPGMVCETSMPSVFTRVSSYLDWIYEMTNIPARS